MYINLKFRSFICFSLILKTKLLTFSLFSFCFLASIQEESFNDKRLRLTQDKELIGRELVTSAAHGDVQNCRLILERERLFKVNQTIHEPSEDRPMSSSYFLNPRQAVTNNTTENVIVTHLMSSGQDIILTNFMSSGHTSLQAAAQNGHIDVCRLLIGEFGADVEYQVLHGLIFIYHYII